MHHLTNGETHIQSSPTEYISHFDVLKEKKKEIK